MDKTYRKMRSKLHKRKETTTDASGSFMFRLFVCMLVFLALAGIRLRGGELYGWVQAQIGACMYGEHGVVQAYNESVEAFNQFCDRVVEARAKR